MTPDALKQFLDKIIAAEVPLSVMIWGPPGIGKSSIVAQVAQAHGLELIDVRLSQLAPTDLRGLPVPSDGVAHWYPPDFLPRSGRGILFFDEINMAAPVVQGIAQQLVLDHRIGSYTVPLGWFVWAAGNRKEDRASVFQMPAPLANRFIHLEVESDLESFRRFAVEQELPEQLVAFLSFRPTLLHALDAQRPAWPSPRSWVFAAYLHALGLSVAPAVGEAAATEFEAFLELYSELIDLDAVLRGDGAALRFPDKPSVRYAVVIGLALRAQGAADARVAFSWLVERAPAEWIQLFVSQLATRLRALGQLGALAECMRDEPRLRTFLAEYTALLAGGTS